MNKSAFKDTTSGAHLGAVCVAAQSHMQSRCITEFEFASVYASAEFALRFGLPLDSSVTIVWSLLGVIGAPNVQVAFTGFGKCLRDWLQRRGIPTAFIFGHENGPRLGVHSHLNVFIPTDFRAEFRSWVQEWCYRFVGSYVSRAVRVTGPKVETSAIHWLKFGYLMKGYDRDRVVQSASSSPDAQVTRLGDIVPFDWRDPGVVTLKHRVGSSRSLGPDRRRIGVPTDLDYLRRKNEVNLSGIFGEYSKAAKWSRPTGGIGPFRSKWQDGVRDARLLYGAELVNLVTGESGKIRVGEDPSEDLAWIDTLNI